MFPFPKGPFTVENMKTGEKVEFRRLRDAVRYFVRSALNERRSKPPR